LKVGGKVALAGKLDARSGSETKTETVTLIDHSGKAKTTGTFAGLKEGAAVEVGKARYRISYRGGDGNDVVLTAATTASPSATARAAAAADSAAPKTARTQNAADASPIPRAWWLVAAALGLLATLMIPVTRRRRGRGRGRGGRHTSAR
jgi:hypothetical protein